MNSLTRITQHMYAHPTSENTAGATASATRVANTTEGNDTLEALSHIAPNKPVSGSSSMLQALTLVLPRTKKENNLPDNFRTKTSRDASPVEPATQTPENHFEKLPNELVAKILACVGDPNSVAEFAKTDRRNCASADIYSQRRFGFGLKLLPPYLGIAQVVSLRIQSFKPDVQATILRFNKPIDIFSDDNVKLIQEMNNKIEDAIRLAKAGFSILAKQDFSEASDLAKRVGQSIPPENYARVVRACVVGSVLAARDKEWVPAKQGFDLASVLVEQTGQSMPLEDYALVVNACVAGAVYAAEEGIWVSAKQGFDLASDLVEQTGQSMPLEDYARVVSACVAGVIQAAEVGLWNFARQGFDLASDLAEQAGLSMPPENYTQVVSACVAGAGDAAGERLWDCARLGLNLAEHFVKQSTQPIPQELRDLREALINR